MDEMIGRAVTPERSPCRGRSMTARPDWPLVNAGFPIPDYTRPSSGG